MAQQKYAEMTFQNREEKNARTNALLFFAKNTPNNLATLMSLRLRFGHDDDVRLVAEGWRRLLPLLRWVRRLGRLPLLPSGCFRLGDGWRPALGAAGALVERFDIGSFSDLKDSIQDLSPISQPNEIIKL